MSPEKVSGKEQNPPTGGQKAAVFLSALGPERAAPILNSLPNAKLKIILGGIAYMRRISPVVQNSILKNVCDELSTGTGQQISEDDRRVGHNILVHELAQRKLKRIGLGAVDAAEIVVPEGETPTLPTIDLKELGPPQEIPEETSPEEERIHEMGERLREMLERSRHFVEGIKGVAFNRPEVMVKLVKSWMEEQA